MTIAAIDRLVHHATVFGLNVESYRRRTAQANALERDNYVSPRIDSNFLSRCLM